MTDGKLSSWWPCCSSASWTGKKDLVLGGATECVPLCENEYVLDSNLAKVLASER